MFLTDFKCLHDIFLGMLTSVFPHHFSNNVSLTLPLSSSSQSNPPLPPERIRIVMVREAGKVQWSEHSNRVQIRAWTPYVVELSLVLFFAPRGFSLGTPIFPSPQEPKKEKKNTAVVDEEPLCVDVLPLNRYLFVIFCYLSQITKPSEKLSDLMIIITTNFNDKLTATLSVLCYFVAKESASVIRQDQVMGGLISSIYVQFMYSCRIWPLEFYCFQAQEQ